MRPNSLSNFGGRFRSTESLWSIASKVCWANQLSVNILATSLKFGQKSGLFVGFDVEGFSTATGIARETVRTAMGLRLFEAQPQQMRDLAYRNLRYCPVCMKESGFHSILFQLPLCSNCPIHHNVKLIRGCVQCRAEIPHSLPSSLPKVYRCTHCGDLLWKPSQMPFQPSQDDSRMDELAAWASNWMKGVCLYSGSAAPLRHWVEHDTGDAWTKKGAPELDGVFTVRKLLGSPRAKYWGGREKIKGEGGWRSCGVEDVYHNVLREISLYSDFKISDFGQWVQEWHEAPQNNQSRRRWAFAAWRCFWEAIASNAELAGDVCRQAAERTSIVFRSNFRELIVPSGFGPEFEVINLLIFREVLRSTFAVLVSRVMASGELPRFRELNDAIAKSAAPVFIIRPLIESAESGSVVEWVHQKEIARFGREVFEAR